MDTCQKAGWNQEVQWMAITREGLKDEVTTAMAGRFPCTWDAFVLAIEEADEDLQCAKDRKKTITTKKAGSSTTTAKSGD